MKTIKLDTPRRTDTSKNVSCQIVVIRDGKGKAVAWVSTTRHSTVVTIADLSDCEISMQRKENEKADRFAPKPKRWPNGDKIKKGES